MNGINDPLIVCMLVVLKYIQEKNRQISRKGGLHLEKNMDSRQARCFPVRCHWMAILLKT